MKNYLKKILIISIILIIIFIIGFLMIGLINININRHRSPSKPVLDDGMIPVIIDNNGTVTTVSLNNESWYDYEQKKWANVVLVNSESRKDYLGTDGKSINQEDILAYYVWIPRYKYKGALKKCSNLVAPNIRDYPECYTFKISNKDKTGLIVWRKEQLMEKYTLDEDELTKEAVLDIEELLKTGRMWYDSIEDVINLYNEETQSNATFQSKFKKNEVVDDGPTTINIAFEARNAPISRGNAITTFKTHPAFIWGGKKIPGIWVGKFEPSAELESSCYRNESEDNCKNVEPRILPNVKQLEYQGIGTQFITSLKFAGGISLDDKILFAGNNVYGVSEKTDSHMMKNSEWGAVAYLSHSKYGLNDQLEENSPRNNITGCGFAKDSTSNKKSICEDKYGEVEDYPQSTTGNISGIFDMAGGSHENVMALLSYDDDIDLDEISVSDNKYFDIYLEKQFASLNDYYYEDYSIELCTLKTCGGHALYETASWYAGSKNFVSESSPWFKRGSIFGFSGANGEANSYSSWRSVLIVGAND